MNTDEDAELKARLLANVTDHPKRCPNCGSRKKEDALDPSIPYVLQLLPMIPATLVCKRCSCHWRPRWSRAFSVGVTIAGFAGAILCVAFILATRNLADRDDLAIAGAFCLASVFLGTGVVGVSSLRGKCGQAKILSVGQQDGAAKPHR